MAKSRQTYWAGFGLLAAIAACGGCGGGRERAPADVPSAAPLTTPGDRFDVVIAGDTPVTVTAVSEDPDDEWYRAVRYDWVAGGQARSGRRTPAEGPLKLPPVAGRGYLYVDAVHREPGAATEQESHMRRLLFKPQRLGENIWRLSFRDPVSTGRKDDLIVTIRFGRRSTSATAPPRPPTTTATGRAAPDVRARPRWGAAELGRAVNANPCAVCRTTEHLVFHVTDARNAYWIRCDRCNRSGISKPTPAEGEASWNRENPPVSPAATTAPARSSAAGPEYTGGSALAERATAPRAG